MNDLKPFKHGEEGTHTACDARLKAEGLKTRCCYCVPHDGCEMRGDHGKLDKWLVKILSALTAVVPTPGSEEVVIGTITLEQAVQEINERFEAALATAHAHPTRVYCEGCQQKDVTRKSWYGGK